MLAVPMSYSVVLPEAILSPVSALATLNVPRLTLADASGFHPPTTLPLLLVFQFPCLRTMMAFLGMPFAVDSKKWISLVPHLQKTSDCQIAIACWFCYLHFIR